MYKRQEEYREEIEYVAEKGIFSGDENGNFNPDMTVTREQAVKIIFSLKNADPSVCLLYTSFHGRETMFTETAGFIVPVWTNGREKLSGKSRLRPIMRK